MSNWSAYNEAATEFHMSLNLQQARITKAREQMEELEALTHHIDHAAATRLLEKIMAEQRGDS